MQSIRRSSSWTDDPNSLSNLECLKELHRYPSTLNSLERLPTNTNKPVANWLKSAQASVNIVEQEKRRNLVVFQSVTKSIEDFRASHLLYKDMLSPHSYSPIVLKPTKPKSKKGRRKQGGYPKRSVLLRGETRNIRNTLKLLRDKGVGPNNLISICLSEIVGETDAARKRRTTEKINYIGTICRRHGVPWVGITIYEKPKGGLLHAHHAVYLKAKILPFIKRWLSKFGTWENDTQATRHGEEFHRCRYIPSRHDSYITKESQYPCEPKNWLKGPTNPFRPRSGECFRGKRWHMTEAVIGQIKRLWWANM